MHAWTAAGYRASARTSLEVTVHRPRSVAALGLLGGALFLLTVVTALRRAMAWMAPNLAAPVSFLLDGAVVVSVAWLAWRAPFAVASTWTSRIRGWTRVFLLGALGAWVARVLVSLLLVLLPVEIIVSVGTWVEAALELLTTAGFVMLTLGLVAAARAAASFTWAGLAGAVLLVSTSVTRFSEHIRLGPLRIFVASSEDFVQRSQRTLDLVAMLLLAVGCLGVGRVLAGGVTVDDYARSLLRPPPPTSDQGVVEARETTARQEVLGRSVPWIAGAVVAKVSLLVVPTVLAALADHPAPFLEATSFVAGDVAATVILLVAFVHACGRGRLGPWPGPPSMLVIVATVARGAAVLTFLGASSQRTTTPGEIAAVLALVADALFFVAALGFRPFVLSGLEPDGDLRLDGRIRQTLLVTCGTAGVAAVLRYAALQTSRIPTTRGTLIAAGAFGVAAAFAAYRLGRAAAQVELRVVSQALRSRAELGPLSAAPIPRA